MLGLQEILGHENLSTTEIYTHVDNKQLKDAVSSNPLANIKQKLAVGKLNLIYGYDLCAAINFDTFSAIIAHFIGVDVANSHSPQIIHSLSYNTHFISISSIK